MIERLLPTGVVSAYRRDDPADAVLLPAEDILMARAVPRRRAEFTTVRHCARLALASLGHPAAPILPGVRGAPIWPAGIVGSMTHCDGYRAAAVTPTSVLTTIGIDAEVHQPLPAGVLDLVASPAERDLLAVLATDRPDVHWDRLLFSAKEAVYKAWSPLTGRWLEFQEVGLVIEPSGRFTARLLVDGPTVAGKELTSLTGRFLVDGPVVLTAVTVGAGG
jgi:4'-phosphopantetheinyl transferase EntD